MKRKLLLILFILIIFCIAGCSNKYKLVYTFEQSSDSYNAYVNLAFSEDGKKIYSTLYNGINIYSLEDEDIILTKTIDTIRNRTEFNARLSTYSQNNIAANYCREINQIVLHDLINNQELARTKTNGRVTSIVLSKDGKYCAYRMWKDGNIKLWNIEIDQTLDIANGKTLAGFDFTAEGDLITIERDGSALSIWDLNSGVLKQTLKISGNGFLDIKTIKNTKQYVFYNDDQRVFSLWDSSTNTIIKSINTYSTPVRVFACSPDGRYVAASYYSRGMELIDFETGKIEIIWSPKYSGVDAVAWSDDGKFLAACTYNKINVWRIRD
ncbi:MAG TPA: hypothetical protein PLZ08_09275 [Bacillota bacterium]|jgi:WD40 repeat protein|nr:hypothetical protein [Bacillota bacterium]HOL10377.1 hypothetical protein [Bacillota bacterium]HPO98128.1 hypothetical protein [Bacillota bacterium]